MQLWLRLVCRVGSAVVVKVGVLYRARGCSCGKGWCIGLEVQLWLRLVYIGLCVVVVKVGV